MNKPQTGIGKCSLCHKTAELQESHIIPSFVFKWIKRNNFTGRLRSTGNIDIPIQDGPKKPLLCSTCEEKFSNPEGKFSQLIFRPYLTGTAQDVEYGPWLRYFTISVAYRVILDLKSQLLAAMSANEQKKLKRAMRKWKDYLLGEKSLEEYETHLLPLDYVVKMDAPAPKINAYMMGSSDYQILGEENEIAVYIKLPGFAFFVAVAPSAFEGFENTQIFDQGLLKLKSNKIYTVPGEYFAVIRERSYKIAEAKMSENQRQKIVQAAEKLKTTDPDRYHASISHKTQTYQEMLDAKAAAQLKNKKSE